MLRFGVDCFGPSVPFLENVFVMIKHSSLIYGLTGLMCFMISSSAQAETLREAVSAALASHPAVDIAAARKDAASEAEREEFSNLFPQISTTLTGGRVYGDNSTSRGLTVSRGAAYSWLWEGNASLTQPIFDGFETYNRIDAARARENAAEYTLADARQGIALHAAQSFLNVMRAQEAYAKTLSYQDRIKDYLSRINGMVEAGAADESEVAQAKNILAQLENSVAEMDGQVRLALADYAEAVGAMPAGELHDPELGQAMVFATAEDAIAHATQYHPLLLSARQNLDAEDNEVRADKGVLLPTLDGEISYLERDQKEEIGGEATDARAVMRMNWAFSTGGGQLARIRKSKAEKSEALARTAQTQREIERDIRRSFAELATSAKQNELNVKRAVVTKELFDTYEKQFEASKVRLLQLMQAENQVFSTEMEQINSKYRMMMAEYGILASAGTLLDTLNLSGEGALPQMPEAPVAETFSAPVISDMPAPADVQTEVAEPEVEPVFIPAATNSVYPAEDYSLSSNDGVLPVKGE